MIRKILLNWLLAVMLIPVSAAAESEWDENPQSQSEPATITVYRSESCECCHKWIEHLDRHDFQVIDKVSSDMRDIKQQLGLPPQMTSCHTAKIDGYLIEGHVPAGDIKHLISSKPDIAGLSVPQMPVGTPGMEMGPRKDAFNVIAFDDDQQFKLFNQYQLDADNRYQSANHYE